MKRDAALILNHASRNGRSSGSWGYLDTNFTLRYQKAFITVSVCTARLIRFSQSSQYILHYKLAVIILKKTTHFPAAVLLKLGLAQRSGG